MVRANSGAVNALGSCRMPDRAGRPVSFGIRLREVEEQDFARLPGLDRDRRFLAYGDGIAFGQRFAIDRYAAADHLQPAMPASAEFVGDLLTGGQFRDVDFRVLIDD
jgi:hypothetical protein